MILFHTDLIAITLPGVKVLKVTFQMSSHEELWLPSYSYWLVHSPVV